MRPAGSMAGFVALRSESTGSMASPGRKIKHRLPHSIRTRRISVWPSEYTDYSVASAQLRTYRVRDFIKTLEARDVRSGFCDSSSDNPTPSAIVVGLGAMVGTLVPVLIERIDLLISGRGVLLLSGTFLMLTGVIVCRRAGQLRDHVRKKTNSARDSLEYRTRLLIAITSGLLCSDGMVEVPKGPGLGVHLNQCTLERYRVF